MVQRVPKSQAQIWRMIAFAPVAGYRLAQSGKSWVRDFPTREAALGAKRKLVALGIAYVCRKADRRNPKPRMIVNNVSREGFGGKLNARPIASGWRMRKRRG